MGPTTAGEGNAFIDNLMTKLATFVSIRREARHASRPATTLSLETIKSIISISLDLARTALAYILAMQDWSEASTA